MDKRYLITKAGRFGEYTYCEIVSEADKSYVVLVDGGWQRVKKDDVLRMDATPELFDLVQALEAERGAQLGAAHDLYRERLQQTHRNYDAKLAALLAAPARADETPDGA
jgi:hypothetical protein